MRRLRLPFAASVAGHAAVLVLLVLFATQLPPLQLPQPALKGGIEVMLAPAEAPPETPPPEPIAETPPPEPVAEKPPPEPEPPPVATAEPESPPPPSTTIVQKPIVKPAPHRPPPQPVRKTPPEPTPTALPAPAMPVAPQPAPVQTAAIPMPAPAAQPGPIVSAGYRAALSAWLESHKRYPETARARGEEGRAVLRFRVDRSGRVLDYAVVSSTGYPDLDAAIEGMMRGASLPPFPADMTATDVQVSVTVRFALAH